MISVYNTYISPGAKAKVAELLDSTFLSEGKLVKEFESLLHQRLAIENPVALNSGTTALHLALVLAGVGEGDEVIIPAQTFIATGLVVVQQKAIPVFADIDYHTGNISALSLREKITPKTKAIIVVHWGGYPCDMDEIQEVAKSYNIPVIEDAAHALGAEYKGRAIGSISEYTCFSFQAIKHLTTGDGGAVACRSRENWKRAMVARWFGIDRDKAEPSILGERIYSVEELGFKYHLNDYCAALGIANMDGLDARLQRRRTIAAFYDQELSGVAGITPFLYSPDRKSSYWLYGCHVERRKDFINALNSRGVTASVIHQRIDRNAIFGLKDLPHQQEFELTQIHIPIHDAVDAEKAQHVVSSIKLGW
jgi:perosamine synthetase